MNDPKAYQILADIVLAMHLGIVVFVAAYTLFGIIVIATWIFVPPAWKRSGAHHKGCAPKTPLG